MEDTHMKEAEATFQAPQVVVATTGDPTDVDEEHSSTSTTPPPLTHEVAAAAAAAFSTAVEHPQEKQITSDSSEVTRTAMLTYCNSAAVTIQGLAAQYQRLVDVLKQTDTQRSEPKVADPTEQQQSPVAAVATTSSSSTSSGAALQFPEHLPADISDFRSDLYVKVGKGCVSIRNIGTVAHGLKKAEQSPVSGEMTKVGRGMYLLTISHKRSAPSSTKEKVVSNDGDNTADYVVEGEDGKKSDKRKTKKSKKMAPESADDIPEDLNVVPEEFCRAYPKCIVLSRNQVVAIGLTCKLGFKLIRPTSPVIEKFKEAVGNPKLTPYTYELTPDDSHESLRFLSEVRKYFRSAHINSEYEKYSKYVKPVV